jgi:23S rRNA (cytidine1920-2'-O)/16S rRNA (cytidine1409-2'-O)-methyltransferase
MKFRLDELVVQQGLADSRSRAKALIMAGKVRHGTEILDKAGKVYPQDIQLEVEKPPRFVGRGGEKLSGFLEKFPLEVKDKVILDVGASTGGFTDCLLQLGAREAVCVDVGHGQLHYKLRQDPRVHNLERVNARHLTADKLPYPSYSIIVMDLSFISLSKVLPAIWPLLDADGVLIALVKPQFEAGKSDADEGKGVISNPALRQQILDGVKQWVHDELPGSREYGECPSPILGATGNQEFLVGWTKAEKESA